MEEYNPKIHCCSRWYKDFCDCIKDHLQQAKKDIRDSNIAKTLKVLDSNNIDYQYSKTQNVVIVNPNTDHAYLSLKRDRGLFKVRFKGNSNWYTYSKVKFLKRFK